MTVFFGLSFVATKFALRGFEPFLLATLRFTAAGAVLWVVLRLRGERRPRQPGELRRIALLGFVSLTVYFAFETTGIARTSAGNAAILIAAIPVFVSVLNAIARRERNTAPQWVGVALSFAGVVALIELARSGEGGSTLLGDLLVLAAALSAAVYQIMARRLLVTRSALYVTTYQNLFGALFMAPLAAAEAAVLGARAPTAAASAALVYLTLACSVLAYLLMNFGLRHVEANRASVFANLVPVVAVAAAYVVLGERFTAAQALAAAVVVAGVWLANRGVREPRSPSGG
jgi:drug/metabolite transporter (DMT)-like permease